jgi:hypothetical protein
MVIHPVVTQVNGIVSVQLTVVWTGASTDATDMQRIQAYGDPKVNLGGLFTDPASPSFQFVFPASELWAGITTQMPSYTARFMAYQPVQGAGSCGCSGSSGQAPYNTTIWTGSGYGCQSVMITTGSNATTPPGQGPLDSIVSDPIHAATVWASVMDTRIAAAMAVLRAYNPPQLVSLPDATI